MLPLQFVTAKATENNLHHLSGIAFFVPKTTEIICVIPAHSVPPLTRLVLPGDLDDGDEYVDQVVRYAVEHLDAAVR